MGSDPWYDAGHDQPTVTCILSGIGDLASNLTSLYLEVPPQAVDLDITYRAHGSITLSRCEQVCFQFERNCHDPEGHYCHEVACLSVLTTLVRAPKANVLKLEITSDSAHGLGHVIRALEKGYWPELRRIAGSYTLFKSDTEKDPWKRNDAAQLAAAFKRVCKDLGIVSKLVFSTTAQF